jgi:Domain of unknown function (DUF4398)
MTVKNPCARGRGGIGAVVGLALLAACSTQPQSSSSAMPQAKQAIENAIHDGAQQRDPADLATAQQKLGLAQKSAENGLYDDARRFAEEAEIDARLASARSRTVAASNALSQLQGKTPPEAQ